MIAAKLWCLPGSHYVQMRVKSQDKRGFSFFAQNGILIESVEYPALGDIIIFVRGDTKYLDNIIATSGYCSSKIEKVLQIREAINEFNEKLTS